MVHYTLLLKRFRGGLVSRLIDVSTNSRLESNKQEPDPAVVHHTLLQGGWAFSYGRGTPVSLKWRVGAYVLPRALGPA